MEKNQFKAGIAPSVEEIKSVVALAIGKGVTGDFLHTAVKYVDDLENC
jgi:hypothetical protein